MLLELKVYDHGLSPLQMQNPYSIFFWGGEGGDIKSLFVNPNKPNLIYLMSPFPTLVVSGVYFHFYLI